MLAPTYLSVTGGIRFPDPSPVGLATIVVDGDLSSRARDVSTSPKARPSQIPARRHQEPEARLQLKLWPGRKSSNSRRPSDVRRCQCSSRPQAKVGGGWQAEDSGSGGLHAGPLAGRCGLRPLPLLKQQHERKSCDDDEHSLHPKSPFGGISTILVAQLPSSSPPDERKLPHAHRTAHLFTIFARNRTVSPSSFHIQPTLNSAP